MRMFLRSTILFLASVSALSEAASWHWEDHGVDTYSGQINLIDESGATLSFDRFDGSSSAPLWGASAVQSPIVIAGGGGAGADISVKMYRSGVNQTKYECEAPKEWKVFATPVQACAPNYAINLAGIRTWVTEVDALTFRPRLAVFREGQGWVELTNNICGVVQVIQTCEDL